MGKYIDKSLRFVSGVDEIFGIGFWVIVTFVSYWGLGYQINGDLVGVFLVVGVLLAINFGTFLFSLVISLVLGIFMGIGKSSVSLVSLFKVSLFVIGVCNGVSIFISNTVLAIGLGVFVLTFVMVVFLMWDNRNRKSNLIDEENSIE